MKKVSLALLAVALLSACGQRGASPETGEKPAASEPVDATNAARTAADASPAPTADAGARRLERYKRALLPLVAGSYTGDCTTKSGASLRSAVEIAPDGVVTASGMRAHGILEPGAMFGVVREASGARAGSFALTAGADKEGWTVATLPGKADGILYGERNDGIECVNTGRMSRSQQIYPLLAPYFAAGAGALLCDDGSALPKRLKIVPGKATVAIGSDSVQLMRAGWSETAIVDPGRASLTYQTGASEDDMVVMQLGPGGAIMMLSVLDGPSRKVTSCTSHAQ